MTTDGTTTEGTPIEPWLRDILRCPAGRHELIDVTDEAGEPAFECAEACETAAPEGNRLRFPIRDGIPVLLIDDAARVTR